MTAPEPDRYRLPLAPAEPVEAPREAPRGGAGDPRTPDWLGSVDEPEAPPADRGAVVGGLHVLRGGELDSLPVADDPEVEAAIDEADQVGYRGMTPPTAAEAARLAEDAVAWRRGLRDSLARAGFDGPDAEEEFLDGATIFAPAKLAAAQRMRDYLAAVHAFLCRYVAFPSEHEPVAIALWVAHAHLVEHFETSPILAVTSAEMRSGKTRTLDCLEVLVPTPFRVVIPSEAVVYTVLSQRPRPTLLLDEADAIFGPRTAERYEGVRAVLNSGNRTGTPVLRVKLEGRRREVEAFDVYGPKAIAGIGDLPATVADRAIPIRLKRRAPSEPVARFRRRTAEAEAVAIRLDTNVSLVTDVPVPDELPDRAADSWEVLLSIADAAGGAWPMLGRLAAVALSGEDETPVSVGMRLLADIRDAFGAEDHIGTGDLLHRLHEMDDAPWADWYGAPLSARGLAKLLGPYRVLPVLRRVRGERHRGYFAADFADAWARYVLLPSPAPVTTVTTVTPDGDEQPTVTDVTHGTGAEAGTPTDAIPWWSPCRDYGAHQSAHRMVDGSAVCDICAGASA